MIGLGGGSAVAGVSLVAVGFHAVKHTFYGAAFLMVVGATATHIGSQIAIGAVERLAGKQ